MRTLALCVLSIVVGGGCVANEDDEPGPYPEPAPDAAPERQMSDWNGQYSLTWSCVGTEWLGGANDVPEPCPVNEDCGPSSCDPVVEGTATSVIGADTAVINRAGSDSPAMLFWAMSSAPPKAYAWPTHEWGIYGFYVDFAYYEHDRRTFQPYFVAPTSGGFDADIQLQGQPPNTQNEFYDTCVTWHVTATRVCDADASGGPRTCP